MLIGVRAIVTRLPTVGFLFDPGNDWIHEHFKDSGWLCRFEGKYIFKELFSADAATDFEVLFILGYTKILPARIRETNQFNLVIHESALPLGRGFSPVQWQVLEGVNQIPVCLIEATEKVDEGDILGRAVICLRGDELFPEIRRAQAQTTKQLIADFLTEYPKVNRKPQSGTPSYYRRRNREDDKLDFDAPLSSQFNKLRIVDNERYSAYFDAYGHRYELKINKMGKDE